MSPENALVCIWAGFLVLGVGAASAAFRWGVRSGQFGDQERARSLPLLAAIPPQGPDDRRGRS